MGLFPSYTAPDTLIKFCILFYSILKQIACIDINISFDICGTSFFTISFHFVLFFFQSKNWDREQMAAFTQAAYRKFGHSIDQWSVKALESMKKLLVGLDANELAELAGDVFDQG